MDKKDLEEIIKELSSDKCIWLISLNSFLETTNSETNDIKSPITKNYIDKMFQDCVGLKNNKGE